MDIEAKLPVLTIPSEGELQHLSRWGRVAFAARCARRVQRLAVQNMPTVHQKAFKALDKGITRVEAFAASGRAVSRIAGASAAVASEYAHLSRVFEAAFAAARTAVYSAIRAAASAAHDAARAACGAADFEPLVIAAIRADFELLRAATSRKGSKDMTPVPPEFFGPLFPFGLPEGWPATEPPSDGLQLVVEFEATENADVQAEAVDLADRLDDLHRALGGRGLQVAKVEIEQSVGMAVPS